jgi:hypothetical protein
MIALFASRPTNPGLEKLSKNIVEFAAARNFQEYSPILYNSGTNLYQDLSGIAHKTPQAFIGHKTVKNEEKMYLPLTDEISSELSPLITSNLWNEHISPPDLKLSPASELNPLSNPTRSDGFESDPEDFDELVELVTDGLSENADSLALAKPLVRPEVPIPGLNRDPEDISNSVAEVRKLFVKDDKSHIPLALPGEQPSFFSNHGEHSEPASINSNDEIQDTNPVAVNLAAQIAKLDADTPSPELAATFAQEIFHRRPKSVKRPRAFSKGKRLQEGRRFATATKLDEQI